METEEIEKYLIERGVKPTANRILVVRELMDATHPVNLAEMEIALAPMDKSSIFRVIELLAKHDVIHVIEDGSRSLKYEICNNKAHHTFSDQHAHFYCEECGSTLCLDDVSLPNVALPEIYKVRSVNFMFKGICPKCNREDKTWVICQQQ